MWISHVTSTNESLHMNDSCHTHEWAMFYIRMSHVTHIKAPAQWRHRAQSQNWVVSHWVMSHMWISHVLHTMESSHVNASRLACEWVTSHIRMSHVTHMNTSCHTYEWVMFHIRKSHHIYITHVSHICMSNNNIQLSHIPHTNESCHTHDLPAQGQHRVQSQKWVMWHIQISHVSYTNESSDSLTHMNAWHPTYEWVMSHKWTSCAGAAHSAVTETSHVTHTNNSRLSDTPNAIGCEKVTSQVQLKQHKYHK